MVKCLVGTAVCEIARTVVWEDGTREGPSYPISPGYRGIKQSHLQRKRVLATISATAANLHVIANEQRERGKLSQAIVDLNEATS